MIEADARFSQDTPGMELEYTKDTFIAEEDDMEESDRQLIFKYIHKKFSTKKREYTTTMNKLDLMEVEVDPLEGTSRATEFVNR